MNARLRPTISPTLPPVIISDAITSAYSVIAVWIPVTVVPTSLATVAIAVFITVVSSAITNWPAANVNNTSPAAPAARPAVSLIAGIRPARQAFDNRSCPPPESRDAALIQVVLTVERRFGPI